MKISKQQLDKLVESIIKEWPLNPPTPGPGRPGKPKSSPSSPSSPDKTRQSEARMTLKIFTDMSYFKQALIDSGDFHRDWVQRYTHGIYKTLRDFDVIPHECEFKIGKQDDEVLVKLPNPRFAKKLASDHSQRRRDKDADFGDLTTWPDEVWHDGKSNVVTFWYD